VRVWGTIVDVAIAPLMMTYLVLLRLLRKGAIARMRLAIALRGFSVAVSKE
jgi:hypothetical protein